MEISCCRQPVKVAEFCIKTKEGKKAGYLNEYMLEGICEQCGTLVILYLYQTVNKQQAKKCKQCERENTIKSSRCEHCGEDLSDNANYILIENDKFSKEYRGYKAKKFKAGVVFQEERFKSREVDKRWWLPYFRFGKEGLRCYSNLSTMKKEPAGRDLYRLKAEIEQRGSQNPLVA